MNRRSGFSVASKEFIDAMMGYLEYVPLILTLTPMVSHGMVTAALRSFLDAKCVSSDKQEERIVYKIRSDEFGSFRRFDENLSAAASTSRSLPRLLTVGLVATLEYLLTLLMKEVAKQFPNEIFKDKTIATRDVVKFNSIDELKEFVIFDEIDSAQRENLENQVKWILSKAGLDDIVPHYPDWPKLVELFERRNLFVHANGIVNDQYVRAAKKHKFAGETPLKVGDELHAGTQYYTASVHTVLHFGAMLTQIVWRKCHPAEVDRSDKSISDLGYELIARGQFQLAVKILEAAKTIRGVSEIRHRMNVVNLANAYRLSGDSEECQKVLESMDWTAVGPQFKISIAAVKGDVDEVVYLMRKHGQNEDCASLQDYQEWPVFYGIRSETRFLDAFKEVFGIDYVPSAKQQAGLAQVMDWAKDQKLLNDPGNAPEPIEVSISGGSKTLLN